MICPLAIALCALPSRPPLPLPSPSPRLPLPFHPSSELPKPSQEGEMVQPNMVGRPVRGSLGERRPRAVSCDSMLTDGRQRAEVRAGTRGHVDSLAILAPDIGKPTGVSPLCALVGNKRGSHLTSLQIFIFQAEGVARSRKSASVHEDGRVSRPCACSRQGSLASSRNSFAFLGKR